MKTTINATSTSPLRVGCFALLAAVIVAFAPQSAWAKDPVPFRAVFDTAFESTVNFPFANVHVIGEGRATHLGLTAIETTDQVVNLLTGEATATYHFTSAKGDEVVVEMDFLALVTPTGFSFSGSWEITDGTGRFAKASGSGTLDGRADFTGPTDGLGHFTMTGTIASPGSLK